MLIASCPPVKVRIGVRQRACSSAGSCVTFSPVTASFAGQQVPVRLGPLLEGAWRAAGDPAHGADDGRIAELPTAGSVQRNRAFTRACQAEVGGLTPMRGTRRSADRRWLARGP